MAVLTHLETDTGTNVDISGATAVGAYTANADKLIMVDVSIDAVAGNGDYVMYVTRQIGGSGSAYRILPQTTMTAASGLTAISGQSGWITVRNGDVLTVYVDGLAGDTSTPDWTTRWFEDSGTAGVAVASIATDAITAAAIKADAVTKIQNGLATSSALATVDGIVDDILVDTSTTLDGKLNTIDTNVDSILADTGTDGVVVASGQTVATVTNLTNLPTMPADWVTASGLKADAVTEIQSGLALEATLTAIKAKTDNLPADPADDSDIDAQLAAIKAETAAILVDTGTTLDTKITTIDGIVDAIKLKTDLIPATPAQAGEYTAAIAAVQADLDNPDQYKADVSSLAKATDLQDVEDKIDLIDVTTVANGGKIDAVDTKVSAIDTDTIMSFMIDGFTFEQIIQIMAATLAGKLTRSGDTLTFKDLADTVNRVVVETDENKQRTGITYTV